jgi:hypothetical protein
MHARNYKCINKFGCETARKKRIGILKENSKTILWKRGVRVVDWAIS